MDVRALFGLSILGSLVSCSVISALYVWPWLQSVERNRALTLLTAPHMFLRFIGLSFLVTGVVSPSLPSQFAVPAAYGDFAAGVLAIIATSALARRARWATAAVWVFNLWGAADLLNAFYEGARVQIQPGSLGAGFFLVTAIVPLLLTGHFLIFRLLVRRATVTGRDATLKVASSASRGVVDAAGGI
jgi:hypothetical protein